MVAFVLPSRETCFIEPSAPGAGYWSTEDLTHIPTIRPYYRLIHRPGSCHKWTTAGALFLIDNSFMETTSSVEVARSSAADYIGRLYHCSIFESVHVGASCPKSTVMQRRKMGEVRSRL